MSPGVLMARIRALTTRIMEYQSKFDSGEFNTHGGAVVLQKARTEREAVQRQLPALEIVATGVSCRDCKHFLEVVDERSCIRALVLHDGPVLDTAIARVDGPCGPSASQFESVHA